MTKMKQKFNKSQHNKFTNHFNIKNSPSEIEERFYKKTKKYIKYIKWIPGLKMIWIWNSISMNCSNNESDIDLLIVTTTNSMWLNRILITLIFQLLWVRKTAKKHAWRFCLSFFSTIDWLDFNSWKLENDIYLYFWIVYFKPILDFNNTYDLLLEKNSNWADFNEYLDIIEENRKYITITSPQPSPLKEREQKQKNAASFSLKGERIQVWGINYLFKKIFLPKTLKHYAKIWKPFWVIINDNILKFHNWDIRKDIKKELV
jgi:hypothetical protein